VGRKYPGKVVLVIDALCYSTTDIFTAGFQDHGIGQIVGTSGHTGAGGANVWTYDFFTDLPDFKTLPKGVSFRTAIRRSTRVGSNMGMPLEDLGVKPNVIHFMTRRDILGNNADLIAEAARVLVTN
jgi:C-terminal processing protease CtpA/Prc